MSIIENKIVNAIIFFASKSPEHKIPRLKLMKLLWLADRIHLNKYGRLILKDSYNALPHGPVPTKTMNCSKMSVEGAYDVDNYIISTNNSFNSDYFSKSDIEVMDIVWQIYGNFSPYKLRDISHKFPEWLRYKKELEDKNLPNSYNIVIDDFFNAPQAAVDYPYNPEESDKSKVVYHTHSSIQSSLA